MASTSLSVCLDWQQTLWYYGYRNDPSLTSVDTLVLALSSLLFILWSLLVL